LRCDQERVIKAIAFTADALNVVSSSWIRMKVLLDRCCMQYKETDTLSFAENLRAAFLSYSAPTYLTTNVIFYSALGEWDT
jgi:hypothetical protein